MGSADSVKILLKEEEVLRETRSTHPPLLQDSKMPWRNTKQQSKVIRRTSNGTNKPKLPLVLESKCAQTSDVDFWNSLNNHDKFYLPCNPSFGSS
jgi:hypothetical protein